LIEEKQDEKQPRKPIGFISIAVGDGVAAAFRDLGVDYVVPGGQTMNPSTDDILAAVDAVNADTIFVFPNNKNIFLVAERAAEMTEDKKLIVIHSSQFTQGITAMMMYDESADAEANKANGLYAQDLVDKGDLSQVDIISGATETHEIFDAGITMALEQAKGQ
jgi:dihydroxyacetone kinase-like predicted kinase